MSEEEFAVEAKTMTSVFLQLFYSSCHQLAVLLYVTGVRASMKSAATLQSRVQLWVKKG